MATIDAEDVSVSILKNAILFRSGASAKNRFLKAALTERISTYTPDDEKRNGLPSSSIINMYDRWGNGGFGMILTGNVIIDPKHLESAGNAIICKEGDCDERRLAYMSWATRMKQDGALAIVQLSHAGRQTPITVNRTPFSASDVQLKTMRRFRGFGVPTPLTAEQIKTGVIDRFVFAAKFAKETGFDGVELHAAHGYLLSQFTSPTTNKRTDQYGGNLENRLRLIIEIHAAIRAEIPASTKFLVGIKLNSVEFQDAGTTVEEAKQMCRILENEGLDFVELSGGTYESFAFHHKRESTRAREAFFLDYAKEIRPVFQKTVVYVTGGFRSAQAMVAAVEEGVTDGIGLGRPITAEPDLPRKIIQKETLRASASLLNQDDFAITNFGSNSQMEQMGRKPISQLTQGLNEGISDFGKVDVVERYMKAYADYNTRMGATVGSSEPVVGVLVFE